MQLFRWDMLKEYIVKGFTMDDERERRLYQKVTDIYVLCSADYDPNTDITKQFFATVQNKLHFAVTGKTAAEIISERVGS